MFYKRCIDCDELKSRAEMNLTIEGPLCDECWSKTNAHCSDCGIRVDQNNEDQAAIDEDGVIRCKECWEFLVNRGQKR